MHGWSAGIFKQAGNLVLSKQAHMSVANAGGTGQAGAAEKILGALFLCIIVQRGAGSVYQGFATGMCVQQSTQFYTYGKFPAGIAVFGVRNKPQLYRYFQVGGHHFKFLEMRGICFVGKRKC